MVRIIGDSTGSKTKKKALALFCLGTACLAYAVLVSCVDILQICTTFMVQITNGSAVHQYLSKPIHTIYISVYLFNVTNPDAFMSGEDEKLKVEEVGPFTYTEYRYNDKLRICEEEGWMSYEPRSIISFLPNMSVADHDLVNVTMPSLPFLGLASTVSTYPAIARLGYSLLTSQFRSKAFVQTSASSYIWGYSDPIVGMANKVVPGLVTFDKLGLLDRVFDKKRKNSLVLNINGEDKYTVKTRNGHKKLNMADNADPDQCAICDDFKNTYEGVGYPSPVTPETPIRLFKNGVCRILPMVFDKKIVTEEGFDGFVYNLSDNFFSLNPNVSRNRLLDLTDCFYGLPVALSKVHFLDIDPKVYERIEGMKPDPSKNNYIIIEPKVALQLKSYFAVQFNLAMKDVSFLSEARPFSNMALPIGYVIIDQPPLPQETVDVLKNLYNMFPMIIFTFKILCSILAAILIPYSVLLLFSRNQSISMQLSKVDIQASVLQPFIAKDNENF